MSSAPTTSTAPLTLTELRAVDDSEGTSRVEGWTLDGLYELFKIPEVFPVDALTPKPADPSKWEKPHELSGFGTFAARNNHRLGDKLEYSTAVGLDFDGTITTDAALAKLAAFDLVGHTTFNHRSNGGADRFRLFLGVSRPIKSAAEYRAAWDFANALVGGCADAGAKSVVNFWYLPGCPADHEADYQRFRNRGAPLDVDAILATSPPKASAPKTVSPSVASTAAPTSTASTRLRAASAAADVYRAEAVEVIAGAWPAPGERNAARMALLGALARERFTEDMARGFLEAVHQKLGVALNGEASIARATFSRLESGDDVAGWPTLREHVAPEAVDAAEALIKRASDEMTRAGFSKAMGGDATPADVNGTAVRPTIETGADLARIVDMAERAAANDSDLYARGAMIVRVVPRPDDPRARVRREPGTPAIRALKASALRDRLSRVANWTRYDKREKKLVACAPPTDVAECLLGRESWPGIRQLAGIATSPILRTDGTVAQAPGYDAETGYLLAFEEGERVPDGPTREQALTARDRVLSLVVDFPFSTEADRSGWLAMGLTLTCRAAIPGPVPMWIVTSNIRGSGKSKLVDIPAIIVTGRVAARATQPADEAESGKVLTSIAVEADTLVLFDNIDRPLCGGKLDAFLTGERWSDRLLGTNIRIDLPIVTTLAATGNNIEPRGDTLRRVLPVRLQSELERPETRTDFQQPDLLGYVREHRSDLARDLVTIAAAWFAAGRPTAEGIPAWGSFDAWVAIIPHMLRWVDLPDPMQTREGLEEDDPTLTALRTLLAKWGALESSRGNRGLTVRELVDAVYEFGRPRLGSEDIAAALETLSPGSGRERIDVRRLGYVIRGAKGRRIGGKRLVRAVDSHEGLRWTVR